MTMDLGYEDLKKNTASIISKRSSSCLRNEEDGFTSFRDHLLPPVTAATRSGENPNRKTNLKTGLNISEQNIKSAISRRFSKEHVVSQKSSNKLGSARPLASRGGQGERLVLDARHFQGVIHLKIAELSEEIERLHWQYKDAHQEYTNISAYEIKAMELAQDITNFQKILANLNNAFDYINTVKDIKKIESEAEELKKINISEREKIEVLFCERKAKEDFVIQKEINEFIENKVNDTSGTKEKLNILNSRLSQSSTSVQFWKQKIELYNEIRRAAIRDLQSRFPLANEVIKSETDLFKLKIKLQEITKGSYSLGQDEQQKLLEMVKENTKEISVMEYSISDINKKIKDIEELTGNINLSRESEGITEKDKDTYLKNFDNIKNEKIRKLKDLEIQLTDLLNNLQANSSCTDFMNTDEVKLDVQDSPDGLETILEEHSRTLKLLKKMESINVGVTNKCKILDEKCSLLKEELEEYKTSFKLETEFKQRENKLKGEILEVKKEESKCLEDLEMAKLHHKILQQKLSENAKHKVILQLEKKHSELEQENMFNKQAMEEMKKTSINLAEIQKDTLNLIKVFNKQLIISNNGL